MVELGDEFGIPPYLFLTSGASFLGIMLYHLTRHDLVDAELKNSDWVGYPKFCQPGSYWIMLQTQYFIINSHNKFVLIYTQQISQTV